MSYLRSLSGVGLVAVVFVVTVMVPLAWVLTWRHLAADMEARVEKAWAGTVCSMEEFAKHFPRRAEPNQSALRLEHAAALIGVDIVPICGPRYSFPPLAL